MSGRWVTGQLPVFPVTGGSVHSPRGATYLLGEVMGEGSFGAVFDCLGPFDQPFALKPGTRLAVTLVPEAAGEPAWSALSAAGLEAAYGESEPEYPLGLIKEPNPDY